jgi:arylformamidase
MRRVENKAITWFAPRRVPSVGVIALIIGLLLTCCRAGAASDDVVITKDVPYIEIAGVDRNLTSLDVYRPKGGGPYPVVVFIHGGAWRMGDKKNHRDIGLFFAEKGYVTVNINYRLSPDVIHPAHVKDVAAAIAWVARNIGGYGGDPAHLFVMGHSAGAHLAALVSTDGRYLAACGLGLGALSGAIPIDGAGFDIPGLMATHERVYGRMFRTAFGDDPYNWADGSPISHVAPGKSIPPFLVIWAGSGDDARPQTQRFAETLIAAGVPVETYHAQDRTHASVLADIGKPGDETTRMILGFLDKYGAR